MRVDQLQREFDIGARGGRCEAPPEAPPEGGGGGARRPQPEGHANPLRQLAGEAGWPYQPGRHIPNAHRSLEAAEFAREQGVFDAYHRALFSAYFGEGRDIGDVSVLSELGVGVGLEASALEEALASGRYAALVNEATEEARGSGITGTPTFIFEDGERRLPIVGAQEYAVFQNVAQRMGASRRGEEEAAMDFRFSDEEEKLRAGVR